MKITKWSMPAVAACAAVTVAILMLTPEPVMVKSAYAQVVEAIENTKSAQVVHAVVRVNGGQYEMWVTFKPMRAVSKSHEGVWVCDTGSMIETQYRSASNTITIKDTSLETSQANSLSQYCDELIESSKAEGAVVTNARQGNLLVYSIKEAGHMGGRANISIDTKSNRVVALESQAQGQHSRLDFDYPATGPKDIYELGAPRNAKVINERRLDDQAVELLKRTSMAKSKFDTNYRMITYCGRLSEGSNRPQGQSITVAYRKGDQRRRDWFADETLKDLDGSDLPAIERWLAEHEPDNVDIVSSGTAGVSYNLTRQNEVPKHTGRFRRYEEGLWCEEFGKSLPAQSGPNGKLLVTSKFSPASIYGTSAATTTPTSTSAPATVPTLGQYPIRYTVMVNPQRDYLPERIVRESMNVTPQEQAKFKVIYEGIEHPHVTTTTILNYAQTPAGRWYGSRQMREVVPDRSVPGNDISQVKEMIMAYVDAPPLSDDLFDQALFESSLDLPVKPE